MNKGIIALVAMGLGLSALTGCSALTPAPAVTETVTAAPEVTKESAAPEKSESSTGTEKKTSAPEATEDSKLGQTRLTDSQFTDVVREKTTTAYIMSNYEIVDIAQNTCKTYEEGGNLRGVLKSISEKFLDTTANVKMDEEAFFGDLAFISGAGVANYCPAYADQFKAEVEEAVAASKNS